MENSGGNQANVNQAPVNTGLAGRYANALFALANEQSVLDSVEASLEKLSATHAESADFAALIKSPLISRRDAEQGVGAVASHLGIDALTAKFLGVLAQNRRLADLPAIIAAFTRLAAAQRGEVRAQVTSAHPLDAAQVDALKDQLSARVGRDVAVDLNVDPAILGGLVVKLGSQLIDGSIRTRLNSFAQAMKG